MPNLLDLPGELVDRIMDFVMDAPAQTITNFQDTIGFRTSMLRRTRSRLFWYRYRNRLLAKHTYRIQVANRSEMNRLLTPSPPNLPVSMRTRSRTRRRAANPEIFSRSYVRNLELILRLRADQGPILLTEWTPPRKALGPNGEPPVWILRLLNQRILTAGAGMDRLYGAGCVGWITPFSNPTLPIRLSYLLRDWTWELDPQRWTAWGLSQVQHLIIVPEYLGFLIAQTMNFDERSKHSSVRYVIEAALLSFVFGAPPWVRKITIRAEAAANNNARVGYSELERAWQYLNHQLPAGPAGQYRRWYAPLRRLRKGRNLAEYDVNFEY